MKKLIGITGKAGSGKDTFAWYLNQIDRNVMTYALADPLKRAASELFGIPLNSFYDRELKEKIIDTWGMSPRDIMQQLGTECIREKFGDDFWLKRAEQQIKLNSDKDTIFVVTDVRFENEAQWIRVKDGTLVSIQRDNLEDVGSKNHSSEQGVEIFDEDAIIDNNEIITTLNTKAIELLESINAK